MRIFSFLFVFTILIAANFSNTKAATIEITQPEGPAPWTHLENNKSESDFSFVILADNTHTGRIGVFEKAVQKVNLLNPDFAICVGDLIEGFTDSKDLLNNEWNEIQRITAKLKAPFFYTEGNHDFTDEFVAKTWKERVGPSYYHFRYKGVLFISLNSDNIMAFMGSTPGVEGKEGLVREMEWIKNVLKENADARWTFLFLHQPFWDYKKIPKEWIQIEKMLGTRPYTVFAGHYHTYTIEKRNDMDYITLATTGGDSALRGIDYGEFDHVTLVNMTSEGPVIANLLLDGIHDKNVRTKAVREIVEAVERAVSVESETSKDQIFKKGIASFKITNTTGNLMTLKSSFSGSDNVIVRKKETKTISLGSGQTEIIEIPMESSQPCFYGVLNPVEVKLNISVPKPDGSIFTAENKYEVYPETLYQCAFPKNEIKVDGDLTEWGDLPFSSWLGIIPDLGENTQPPLRFAVAHDSKYVYIASQVLDDELCFSEKYGHMKQKGDGLEISLDPRPDPKRSANASIISEWFSGEIYKMFNFSVGLVDENKDQSSIIRGLPKDVLIGRASIKGGYAIEIAIPVYYLNTMWKSWDAFRLNVGVRDLDLSKGNNVTVKWWRPDRFGSRAIPGSGTFIRRDSH